MSEIDVEEALCAAERQVLYMRGQLQTGSSSDAELALAAVKELARIKRGKNLHEGIWLEGSV